ncbi:MAG: DinB family protein [Chloroflexota bacterium]
MTPDQQRLRDDLAAVPERAALAARASAAPPDDAPAPGEWSARENVLHLAAVEDEVWHPRLDALTTETFPHWPWVEPGLWSGPGDDTFDGALAAFAAARALTIARLDALDPEGWAQQGRHDTYGILDVVGLLRIALDHDEEHLRQMGRG